MTNVYFSCPIRSNSDISIHNFINIMEEIGLNVLTKHIQNVCVMKKYIISTRDNIINEKNKLILHKNKIINDKQKDEKIKKLRKDVNKLLKNR